MADTIRSIKRRVSEAIAGRAELGANKGDERVVEEIFEENLDHMLRENEHHNLICSEMKRFGLGFVLAKQSQDSFEASGGPPDRVIHHKDHDGSYYSHQQAVQI